MGIETAVLIALGVGAAATVGSIVESRSARKQQRKAAKVAERRRAIESRRANVANIEDARQAIGSIQNVAAQTGGAGGSGAQGAVSSLTSQFGANATFNQQLLQFAERQGHFLSKAQDAQNRAQTFSAISSLALSTAGAVKK